LHFTWVAFCGWVISKGPASVCEVACNENEEALEFGDGSIALVRSAHDFGGSDVTPCSLDAPEVWILEGEMRRRLEAQRRLRAVVLEFGGDHIGSNIQFKRCVRGCPKCEAERALGIEPEAPWVEEGEEKK
jgi:hypothetical protein